MIKKKSKTEKEAPETITDEMQQEQNTATPAEPVAAQSGVAGETTISEKEALLKKQIDEMRDTNLRLHAEFDNYRKRTIREKIELSKTASEEVIVDLLPVLDDFERALQTCDDAKVEAAFSDGIKLIYNKLVKSLTSKGLEEIQAAGQTFDTDFHEAISHLPGQDENMKNNIVDVVQKGYKLHGKVIRFAKVVVGS